MFPPLPSNTEAAKKELIEDCLIIDCQGTEVTEIGSSSYPVSYKTTKGPILPGSSANLAFAAKEMIGAEDP